MHTRIIPGTGEALPVVGLGTWQAFDVAGKQGYAALGQVLSRFQASGATLIDSSPMYGRAEQVVGDLTEALEHRERLFFATKVWTTGLQEGLRQMKASAAKMRRPRIDLIQVHNLTDWRTQLTTLHRWKDAGKVRYIGLTHYTDASHEELERLLRIEKVDFVQFNYSIAHRHAELRLLDAAAALGVATLINRPLGEGALFSRVRGRSLPGWAADFGICNWSTYFLKYLTSHPAVTCVIPATANPAHLAENLAAGEGPLPEGADRRRMVEYLDF